MASKNRRTPLYPWSNPFSKLNSPAHRCPCLRFDSHLAVSIARLRVKMEVALSFLVGLFHPLQHAGLARRTPGRDSKSDTPRGAGGLMSWTASKAVGHWFRRRA